MSDQGLFNSGFRVPSLPCDIRGTVRAAEEQAQLLNRKQTFVDLGVYRILQENSIVKGQETELKDLLEKLFELQSALPASGPQNDCLRQEIVGVAKEINRLRFATPVPGVLHDSVQALPSTSCPASPWSAHAISALQVVTNERARLEQEPCITSSSSQYCLTGVSTSRVTNPAGSQGTSANDELRCLPSGGSAPACFDLLDYGAEIKSKFKEICAAEEKEYLQSMLADVVHEFLHVVLPRQLHSGSTSSPRAHIPSETWQAVVQKAFLPEAGGHLTMQQLQAIQRSADLIQSDMAALTVANSCLQEFLVETLQHQAQPSRWKEPRHLVMLDTVAALQDNELRQTALQQAAVKAWFFELLTPRQMGLWVGAFGIVADKTHSIDAVINIWRCLVRPSSSCFRLLIDALGAVAESREPTSAPADHSLSSHTSATSAGACSTHL